MKNDNTKKCDYILRDTYLKRPLEKNLYMGKKYCINDSIFINGRRIRIESLMSLDATELWYAVHPSLRPEIKQKKISIDRLTYSKLKAIMLETNKDLVLEVESISRNNVFKNKLLKEIKEGTLGTEKSSFRKLK